MDQKRLFLAIAISVAILLGSQYLLPKRPAPIPPTDLTASATTPTPPATQFANPGSQPEPVPPPRNSPRLPVEAARVQGTINLAGGRLDDLVLRDYHEEVSPDSPLVRVLEPKSDPEPNYLEFGWTAPQGVRVPDDNTLWTASAPALTGAAPVTLSWDNGAGLVFELVYSVDGNYMFTVDQRVRNAGPTPVTVTPWSHVRRDYTPTVAGYYLLHEGYVGVLGGRLQEMKYTAAKDDAAKSRNAPLSIDGPGGWAGITDKYWLTALVPDQASAGTTQFRYFTNNGAPRYEVAFQPDAAQTVAPGETGSTTVRAFAGAKEVHLLDNYMDQLHIPLFDHAVDFGWFDFLTKPIFLGLDWLYHQTGNFGVAILIFTMFMKGLFFPLANRSYKSMSKMKLLGPKMTALRERYKEEPSKLQGEMMALYKTEGVNPVSGCLPMLLQVPVFFCLYKVIFVTIEMRHAPFFGWIHDLSAVDPTNVFNLFGLIPVQPQDYLPLLHLGIWPLIMGVTMFLQQKLNPPPPDPVQARLFQFMPIIFTFMLARFPAGLVIYWSWNNTLTILQQWFIMRRSRLSSGTGVAVRT